MATQEGLIPESAGYEKGDSGSDVEKMQAWLTRFGYLDSSILDQFGLSHDEAEPPPRSPGNFDTNTERALTKMQEFHGLPPTGILDEATLEVLQAPRCGVPDAPTKEESNTALAEIGTKWNTTNLGWGLGTHTSDLTTAQVRSAIQIGFRMWSAVTPLTFTERSYSSNPEILISFGGTNHPPCPSPFGPTVLAHAYYPPPNGGSFAGDAHFNNGRTWSISSPVPRGSIDLPTVAGHEFGHSLGLAHSSVASALMAPTYAGLRRSLHSDDIRRIQALYGQRQQISTTPTRVFVTPHTKNAWAQLTGFGWVKIKPTTAEGVTTTFATLVAARKAQAAATILIENGEITAAYR